MKPGCKRLAAAAALMFVAGAASAATVSKVNAKKKLVIVDLGEDESFAKDAAICFFSAPGKKIDCGIVIRTKGTQASVRMKSAKKLKRIKPGVEARAPDADGAPESQPAAGAPAANIGKQSPFRVWGVYSPALATPSTYAKLGYAAPTTEQPETLWKADSTVATALFAFNLQVGIPLGAFSLNPGLRYRTFTPSLIDADYIPQKENPYVSTEQKATALGLFVDFQYFRMPMLTASSLWLASGLDVDQSTVTITATKKDDTDQIPEAEVTAATSKLTVASLRASAGFDLVFAKPMGAFFGLTLMVPLAEFGASFAGELDDAEARDQADPAEDLKTQLAHKKNSVAYEVSIGGVLSF